jgi:hypothetical protein
MKRADEDRTAKKREKRLKKKGKKKTKSKATASTAANGASKTAKNGRKADEDTSDSDDSSDEDGGARKKLKLKSGAPGVVFRGADEREEDDDQPREEEIKVKRIEEALNRPEEAAAETSQTQGLVIVDED